MGVINLGVLIKKVMSRVASAGYIKADSYASSTTGGTIKTDSTYATDITIGGKLKAKEITAEAYEEANDAAFISKATLDNVLAAQPSGGGATVLFEDENPSQSANTWYDLTTSVPTGTKMVIFLCAPASYPWITAYCFMDVSRVLGEGQTGYTSVTAGSGGSNTTVELENTGGRFRIGSGQQVTKVIAIL